MARIRSIKSEFWTDSKIVQLSPFARLFFIGMWNFADDCGHLENEPLRLKLQILPNDDVDSAALLRELQTFGLVRVLSGAIEVPNFERHQKIDRRAACRFPETSLRPTEETTSPPESPRVPPNSGPGMEWNGMEGKGNLEPSSPAPQDDVDEEFEKFWKAYPRRNGKRIGKAKAAAVWKRMANTKRQRAHVAVAHYRKACDQGLTIAADAHRWLRDETFEDWQTPATPGPQNGRDPRQTAPAPYKPFPPPEQREPDPPCEHSDPMCGPCRAANVRKLREMIEAPLPEKRER